MAAAARSNWLWELGRLGIPSRTPRNRTDAALSVDEFGFRRIIVRMRPD